MKNNKTVAVVLSLVVPARTVISVPPNPNKKLELTVSWESASRVVIVPSESPPKKTQPSQVMDQATLFAAAVPVLRMSAVNPNPPATLSISMIGMATSIA